MLDGLKYFHKTKNTRSPLDVITTFLDTRTDDISAVVKGMVLLNTVLNSIEEVAERFELHNELLVLGFLPIVLVCFVLVMYSLY